MQIRSEKKCTERESGGEKEVEKNKGGMWIVKCGELTSNLFWVESSARSCFMVKQKIFYISIIFNYRAKKKIYIKNRKRSFHIQTDRKLKLFI